MIIKKIYFISVLILIASYISINYFIGTGKLSIRFLSDDKKTIKHVFI